MISLVVAAILLLLLQRVQGDKFGGGGKVAAATAAARIVRQVNECGGDGNVAVAAVDKCSLRWCTERSRAPEITFSASLRAPRGLAIRWWHKPPPFGERSYETWRACIWDE